MAALSKFCVIAFPHAYPVIHLVAVKRSVYRGFTVKAITAGELGSQCNLPPTTDKEHKYKRPEQTVEGRF